MPVRQSLLFAHISKKGQFCNWECQCCLFIDVIFRSAVQPHPVYLLPWNKRSSIYCCQKWFSCHFISQGCCAHLPHDNMYIMPGCQSSSRVVNSERVGAYWNAISGVDRCPVNVMKQDVKVRKTLVPVAGGCRLASLKTFDNYVHHCSFCSRCFCQVSHHFLRRLSMSILT